mgnify:FL=1
MIFLEQLVTRSEVFYRHALDAIKAFCTYAVMSKPAGQISGLPNPESIFSTQDHCSWFWMKYMYSKVVQCSAQYEASQVIVMNSEYFSINGKVFSKSNIKLFYLSGRNRFNNNLSQLITLYNNVVGVNELAERISVS